MGIAEILTVIFVVCKILGIGVIASWTWLQVFLLEIIACVIYLVILVGGILFVAWIKK